MITTRKSTGKETAKIKDHAKRLELTIKVNKFDGSDPIKVISFLSELVRECNTLAVTEAQEYFSL